MSGITIRPAFGSRDSDVITASVLGVAHAGPTGGLSDAELLSYFHITQPSDTDMAE